MPKQHQASSTKALLNQLKKQHGFTVSEKSRRGTVKIVPPKGVEGPPYFTHANENAYHQIKRDFKKLYNVVI